MKGFSWQMKQATTLTIECCSQPGKKIKFVEQRALEKLYTNFSIGALGNDFYLSFFAHCGDE